MLHISEMAEFFLVQLENLDIVLQKIVFPDHYSRNHNRKIVTGEKSEQDAWESTCRQALSGAEEAIHHVRILHVTHAYRLLLICRTNEHVCALGFLTSPIARKYSGANPARAKKRIQDSPWKRRELILPLNLRAHWVW